MKKHLYLIGGTMGVGKTTVCKILKEKLDRSVFLDGDWCWDMSPFTVTDETKAMVMENIVFLLKNFLACSEYQNVIFCWVMHEQSIMDEILSRVTPKDCTVHVLSLICDRESLVMRLQKDVDSGIRSADIIERSAARLPLYNLLKSERIDTSNRLPAEVAEHIIRVTQGHNRTEGRNEAYF